MADAATMYRLPGVALFASGTYRGSRWTPATVRRLAENAPALRPLLVPPAVLGHEEEQDWLDRTDLPAAGWVDPATVKAVADPDHPGELILRGDLVNVPAAVAERLKTGEYRYGSAEIYDDFLDDFGKSRGPALRRFALLGGEVPQVKRLGHLPAPVPMAAPVAFADRPPPPAKGAAVVSFADRQTGPTRADLIAAIQAAAPGMSRATLEANTDDALREWVANLPQPQPQPTGTAGMDRATMIAEMVAAGVPQAELDMLDDAGLQAKYAEWKATQAAPPAEPVAAFGDAATMSREELTAELVAAGQDAAALETMSDDDLRKLYADLGLGAVAETPAAEPAVAAMSEQARRQLAQIAATARFAERHGRQLRKDAHAAKVARVAAFCEEMKRAGKLLPSQEHVYRGYLLALDNAAPVHAFSDGGKAVRGTALERAMAQIKAGPVVVRFGERLPGAGPDAQAKAAAAAKAARHAETLTDRQWAQTGFKTRAGFLTKFSERAAAVGDDRALAEFGIN